MIDWGPMFGPSPDGFSEGPVLRGPTETEAHIALDVMRWAAQYGGQTDQAIEFAMHSVMDILMDAEGK